MTPLKNRIQQQGRNSVIVSLLARGWVLKGRVIISIIEIIRIMTIELVSHPGMHLVPEVFMVF